MSSVPRLDEEQVTYLVRFLLSLNDDDLGFIYQCIRRYIGDL